MLKRILLTITILTSLFYNITHATPPICPTVNIIKSTRLSNNTHDNYGTWNLFGTAMTWSVLVGNIKADSISNATTIAAKALGNINKVSGPFIAQSHWVCKYTPEPVNGYYIVASKADPALVNQFG